LEAGPKLLAEGPRATNSEQPNRPEAMGIKFHCPQGHKLNVKAFLAGKKGICPKCGTKLRIPEASEPELLDSEDDESDGSDSVIKSNGAGEVAAVAQGPAPAAPAVSSAPATAAAVGQSDPIAEAPAAIWYVRPPTGGQYGPARGDVMRKWLSEGRVSSDSLVWREGWTDWQNAGKLFPTLNESNSVSSAPVSAPVVSTTVPVASRSSQRTANLYESKKRDSNAMAIAVLVGLGVLCVILIVVLAFVIVRMNRTA
jgi:hypothetical protein